MGKIEFKVVRDIKLVHFKGQGSFDYEYLVSRIITVNKDPEFDFTFNTFVDFENAHLTATRQGFLKYQDFFKRLQTFTGKRRWAIYSLNEETLQNASVSHIMVSKDIEVKVFNQKAPALDFLGVQLGDLV